MNIKCSDHDFCKTGQKAPLLTPPVRLPFTCAGEFLRTESVQSMKMNEIKPRFSPVTRRTFLKNGIILTAGVAALSGKARAQTNKNSKLRIFQIGAGGIAGLQRQQLKGYDSAEFVGFCDVDS